MFERFVGEARRVAAYAQEEAADLASESIGQEHLLLGLLRARSSPAAAALGRAGVTIDEARRAVDQLFEASLESIGISLDEVLERSGAELPPTIVSRARLPFSPAAKRTLEQALDTARARGDRHIGTEHVLLVLLEDERGDAARLLAALDVEPAAVRRALEG